MTRIDWDAFRKRMARVAEATDAAQRLDPDAARALMDARTRRYAQPPVAAPTGAQLDVLRFELASGLYALDARYVHEVVPVGPIARVPGAADVLLGLMNVRGDLLGVIDLARILGERACDATPRSRVVVLGGAEPEIGAVVDGVRDVVVLAEVDLRESLAAEDGAARGRIRGITADGVSLLDAAALLNDPRLFAGEDDRDGVGGEAT